MKTSGSFDPIVYLQNFDINLKGLESVDFKSENDVLEEGIIAKEGEHLAIFSELIGVAKMSPQMLRTLLE